MDMRISPTFTLPGRFVTSTNLIVAKKRVGKTYKGGVIAEELLAAKRQVVIVDPTHAWWGLRLAADGVRPGFPITIIGGPRGDFPLDPTDGERIADLVVGERVNVILDLSELTKGEEARVMAAFLERLYRKNKAPLHLILDEADTYAPQKPWGEDIRTLGACQSIVRRGGIKGIGVTMITQRVAVLNKDVLSQIDTLFCLRMHAKTDLEAIDDWVKAQGDQARAKELRASLPSLPKGDAWVWSPEDGIFERVTFRDKTTFDSSRTPDDGETVVAPKVLSPVDLRRVSAAFAKARNDAVANDPKELKKKIAELEKRLEMGASEHGSAATIESMAKEVSYLRAQLHDDREWSETLEELIESLTANVDGAITLLDTALDGPIKVLTDARNRFVELAERHVADHPSPQTGRQAPESDVRAAARPARSAHGAGYERRVSGVTAGETAPLPPMHRAFLTALAQNRGGLTKRKILVYASYSSGGATARTFAAMVKAAHVEMTEDTMLITEYGLTALGAFEPLPTGAALRQRIRESLSPMAAAFFVEICAAWPDPISKATILSRTGYASGGATARAFAYLVARDYAAPHPLVRASLIAGDGICG